MIQKETFQFLNDLSKNNNREWFKANDPYYRTALNDIKKFQKDLTDEMNKMDQIEKSKLFRIYRDVRFSKDKTPYNKHFSMSFSREGKHRRGGYYLKITPGDSMIAGGFWNPNPADLKLIRDHIALDDKPLRKILKSKSFKDHFGELKGDQVKTAPKGFSKDHDAIDLLRYKQFLVWHSISDEDLKDANSVKKVAASFKAMHPFFNYMTEILTHDLNGVPLY